LEYFATIKTLVDFFTLEFVVGEEFSAGKGLRADGTISGDDVAEQQIRCNFLVAVMAFILRLVIIFDVGFQYLNITKHFRTVWTLNLF